VQRVEESVQGPGQSLLFAGDAEICREVVFDFGDGRVLFIFAEKGRLFEEQGRSAELGTGGEGFLSDVE